MLLKFAISLFYFILLNSVLFYSICLFCNILSYRNVCELFSSIPSNLHIDYLSIYLLHCIDSFLGVWFMGQDGTFVEPA